MSPDHDQAATANSGLRHEQPTPVLVIESTLRDGQTLADYRHEHPRPPHGWHGVVDHFAWWLDHATGGKVAREGHPRRSCRDEGRAHARAGKHHKR